MSPSSAQTDATRAYFVELAHKTWGYSTYEGVVDRFHASTAKTKIVSSPARTSKSYAAAHDVLPDILHHIAKLRGTPDLKTLRIWIVAPNFSLAKEFDYFYSALIDRRDKLGLQGYYTIQGECNSPAQGNMFIRLRVGQNALGENVDIIIEVRSAANEKVLQSEEVDIAILSEAARLDEVVWTKYLAQRVGRSIWPTTPDRKAMWIHKTILRAAKHPELSIDHFQFTPQANPTFKYERYWIEHQHAELRTRENPEGLTPEQRASEPVFPHDESIGPSVDNGHDCFDPLIECLSMKDAEFAEQFGGQWTFHRGRVVPFRETVSQKGEPSHVIRDDREWFKWCDVHLAFDYGFTDPAVVGFWLIGPNQVVLRKSIYERGLTPDVLADRVRNVIDENGWKGRITRHIGDPKKPEVCEVFRKRGLPIWDMDKNAQADRRAGHLELMNFLATNPTTGEPNMLIHADNTEIIEEWNTLSYKESVLSGKTRNPDTDSAFVGRDDGYDMTRYFVMSHPPVELSSNVVKLSHTDFEKYRQSNLRLARRQHHQLTQTVGRMRSSGLASAGL